MSKAFTGRQGAKKTTPELIRYVKQQYHNRSILGRSYRKKIITGVEEVFAVRLSASLISQIFHSEISALSKDLNDEKRDISEYETTSAGLKNNQTVQRSPIFWEDYPVSLNGEMIHHAGLVLFEEYLSSYSWFERQIICQILSGAVNVEQSKTLCFDSLSRFCPKVLRTLREQRQLLDKSASMETETDLYHLSLPRGQTVKKGDNPLKCRCGKKFPIINGVIFLFTENKFKELYPGYIKI